MTKRDHDLGYPPQPITRRTVTFHYTNHRGDLAVRTVTPIRIAQIRTEHHPEVQWVLQGYCHDRGAERTFALKDIHTAWTPVDPERIPPRVYGPPGPVKTGMEGTEVNHRLHTSEDALKALRNGLDVGRLAWGQHFQWRCIIRQIPPDMNPEEGRYLLGYHASPADYAARRPFIRIKLAMEDVRAVDWFIVPEGAQASEYATWWVYLYHALQEAKDARRAKEG